MTRTELPLCRWRGPELAPDRYVCSSAKIVAPRGAPAAICAVCPFANHAPTSTDVQQALNKVSTDVQQPPSLTRRAWNLVRDAARHIADRGRKVPAAVYQERLEACQGCELYSGNRCLHPSCGCNMASASQHTGALWWASKACPKNPPLWTEYKE